MTRSSTIDPSQHASRPQADENAHWHALVDGQLPPAQAQALHEQLLDDEAAQDTMAHWRAQGDRLHALHQDLLHAPVPDMLLAAALRTADRGQQQARWWRWGGMAASVVLAFGLGWTGRSQWPGLAPGLAPGSSMAIRDAAPLAAETPQRFAQQAAVAHAVYQPEVRHPVEVTAAQQDHLVQWLSKRLGRPLKVPALGSLGYELVGGRLLPGDTGVRAQFMYQNSAGQRITLYLGALAPASASAVRSGLPGPIAPAPGATSPSDTASFQFTQTGPVSGFYWTDAGFGYALSGQLSRPELLSLATAVFQQLNL